MISKIKVIILVLACIFPDRAIQAENESYWFRRASLPTARQEIQPALLNGKIYVVGGYTASLSVSNLVEVYDPLTGFWDTAASLPIPLHHCPTAVVGGLLYVLGGYTNPDLPWITTSVVMVYDPTKDEWTSPTMLPEPRGEIQTIVLNNKIYVIGGHDALGFDVTTVDVYDPIGNSWTRVSAMPTPRHHYAAVTVDSLLYVIGGRQGYWEQQLTLVEVVEAYSPTSDTWYTKTPMLTPRSAFSAGVMNGRIYTFGGEIPHLYDDVEVFDPALDYWSTLDPMFTPRHGTAGVVVGDTIFIIGGAFRQGAGASDANEAFVLGVCVDSDKDGYGDEGTVYNTCPTDNCPGVFNPSQEDDDSDGLGDTCDPCPADPGNDFDLDGICYLADNCPEVYNPDQADSNSNNIGDVCEGCCVNLVGNVNCSILEEPDISDITRLIDFLYLSQEPLCCQEEANIDCSEADEPDISDITRLIDYLYISHMPLCLCP